MRMAITGWSCNGANGHRVTTCRIRSGRRSSFTESRRGDMKSMLSQNRLAVALAIQISLTLVFSSLHVYGQRPSLKRQAPKPAAPKPAAQRPADRGMQVKEIRSGGALDGRGKLWAVVIGVSNYKNLASKEQLEFAHRDAQSFAEFLRSPNGGGFPSSQMTVLTDQNATLSAIRSALGTTLPRSVEPDDMVVIYLAGHGIVEGEHDGYLLAHDSDPQNLYATALQLSELNRIITERLKARTVILIADACHSGQLGWNSRGVGENAVMVNRFLDEVGKSGKGVFRLLGSRQDQLSYEGPTWGSGHGAFTWFLLEGLRGKADRDKDGFVRAGELLDFLSESVPKATESLQHPRASGDIDPGLPMAVVGAAAALKGSVVNDTAASKGSVKGAATSKVAINVGATEKVRVSAASPPQIYSIEVHGAPGLKVYLDNQYRGRVLRSGVLVIGQLKPGEHDLSILSPGIGLISQKISLTTNKKVVNVNAGRSVSSPLVDQIKQSINNKDINGALYLYQQLVEQTPEDPQRANIEST